MAHLGHRDSWHPRDTRPLSGKENPGGKQGPGLFCREGEATGAWDWTGNSNTRFILEKMLGTHICSERGESRACRALDRSPLHPREPGESGKRESLGFHLGLCWLEWVELQSFVFVFSVMSGCRRVVIV